MGYCCWRWWETQRANVGICGWSMALPWWNNFLCGSLLWPRTMAFWSVGVDLTTGRFTGSVKPWTGTISKAACWRVPIAIPKNTVSGVVTHLSTNSTNHQRDVLDWGSFVEHLWWYERLGFSKCTVQHRQLSKLASLQIVLSLRRQNRRIHDLVRELNSFLDLGPFICGNQYVQVVFRWSTAPGICDTLSVFDGTFTSDLQLGPAFLGKLA